ncbi:unnamed protein product, partial [Ectocarpus sp. 6 AP-2014]
MKTPTHGWLGLLIAAAIVSTRVEADSTTSNDCSPDFYRDGECDTHNNNAECEYDGGDCCLCTCQDDTYDCGISGFDCVDPSAECIDDDDIGTETVQNCGDPWAIGDGQCDLDNNKEECGYDRGDCCSCTCVDEDYECGNNGFACLDPSAECVDDDSVTVDMVENCDSRGIGDGQCDLDNNKEECAYDGGDCCSCTCQVPDDGSGDDGSRCGESAVFACIDPDAPCVNDDDITVDIWATCGGYLNFLADGDCDELNNNEECGYDRGDCCSCTCVDEEFECGNNGFACIDPSAECVDDDSVTVDMVENCDSRGIGDGQCDLDNNKEECAFDGGDCCECTCEASASLENLTGLEDDFYSCTSGFDCQDPAAPCFGEEPTLPENEDDDGSMFYEFLDEDDLLTIGTDAVEVGTKTDVSVSATAHDTRPGSSSGDAGCGEAGGNGCTPANTRDGISNEAESRWSCASKIVPGGGPCQIEYVFGEPQDIEDIQVAFWKGDERVRTLEVYFDGTLYRTHESHAGSTFNPLGVSATGISSVILESVDLLENEWISLIEV